MKSRREARFTTRVVEVFGILMFSGHALGSQIGHPMDCSDWVVLEPGFSCSVVVQQGALSPSSALATRGTNLQIDNSGKQLMIRSNVPGDTRTLGRLEIVQIDGSNEHVIAYAEDRSYGPPPQQDWDLRDHIRAVAGDKLVFDATNGRLLIPLYSYCDYHGGRTEDCYSYSPGYWYAALDGFATLFEIFQTYTPTSMALQFRVPAMPEGLDGADHFDTYWGHVSDLPDFTKAQPIECGYPADHQPQAGEYLTVADSSPVPAFGQANYVVTAVNYGSQRRYGQRRVGSVMSGRDPELLPPCQ